MGLWAQQSVNGEVKDENGTPLVGVNIIEKGTSNGTTTDFDGRYTIDVANGATLVFSYIGYQTTEQAVAGQDLRVSHHDPAARHTQDSRRVPAGTTRGDTTVNGGGHPGTLTRER